MRTGDVVQLGRHRLLCGDAFNPVHVDVLLDGGRPDMLYCDPPYGIGLKTNRARRNPKEISRSERLGAWGKDYPPVIGDSESFDPGFLISAFSECSEQFWWGADNYIERVPKPSEGSWVVWDKRIDAGCDAMLGSSFELCWSRTPHKREIARIRWMGLLGTEREPGRKRLHPAHKPVLLAEWFIARYSKPDAVILDLFGGSGGTLLACDRLGRTCYMAEISPDYCDVIVGRYAEMAKQPRLMNVG